MRKKKQMESYKAGMKAGAAPFEQKFEDTAKKIQDTDSHIDEIVKNQRKEQKIIDKVIEGTQQNEKEIEKLDKAVGDNMVKMSKSQRKVSNMELRMSSITTNCAQCGCLIDSHQLICSRCGAVSKLFPYELSDFNITDECYKGVESMASLIKESNDVEEGWLYEELYEKFIKMKKIRNIAYKAMKDKGEENAPIYKKIYGLTQKFFKNYQKKRIEIAVVGTVKAGKSSLINSLIGTKLASVDPTPETSILVKYRTTSAGNYLRIVFYTEAQWNKLWKSAKDATVFRSEYDRLGAEKIKDKYLNQRVKIIKCTSEELPTCMMEWSKSDAPKHFFVKEIEVGYQSDTIPHDVYLVDTPGLSDPVKYRLDITRRYIKNSDWILACITCENLSGQPEFNFLSKVIANKGGEVEKIFVVATKKDMLTKTEGEKKVSEFLERLGALYDNKSMAVSRFSFVAAECHLLTEKVLRGEELDDEEDEKLGSVLWRLKVGYSDIVQRSDDILRYAGVKELFERIDNVVLRNRRNYIIAEITEDYNRCMKVINENAATYLDDKMEYLKTISNNRELDQNQIEELEKNNEEIEILQGKIREIRENLEREISSNTTGKEM